MEDDVFKNLRLSDLSEPPLIEHGYEFIMLLPRKQAPNGWHVVLKEHGLNSHSQHTSRGLMLSFTTPNYIEFENVKKRLLQMAWAGEVLQWWMRQYTNIRLTRHIDDAAATRISQVPDISSPVALSRGVQHAPEIVDAHRNARRAAAEAKELAARQQRQRYLEERGALAAKDKADYDEAVKNGETRTLSEWVRTRPELPPFEEWQLAIEAGEEPQLMLPAAAGGPAIDEEDRLASELDAAEIARAEAAEREAQAANRQTSYDPVEAHRIERETFAMLDYGKQLAYDNVRYFFIEISEPDQAYAFDDVVREATPENRALVTEDVREALDRLISEGIVREDPDGFRWIEEQADGRNS